MVGKTHQLVGFTTVYSLAIIAELQNLNTQTVIASLLLISLGSLFPDLDNEDNRIYTLFPVGHKLISEIGERAFGKHRSISHSLIGIAIVYFVSRWLIYMIPPENNLDLNVLWISFFASFLSHIAADALTKEGIPLLWPIRAKIGIPPIELFRIKTGKFVEKYIVRSLIILYLAGITIIYWERVLAMF